MSTSVSDDWTRGGTAPLSEVADHYAIALMAVEAHRAIDELYFDACARVRLGALYDHEVRPGEGKLGRTYAKLLGAIDAMQHEMEISLLQHGVEESMILELGRRLI